MNDIERIDWWNKENQSLVERLIPLERELNYRLLCEHIKQLKNDKNNKKHNSV